MTPITPVVPGFNLEITTYAKDQPEYIPLPSHRQPDGTVTTRWSLSWRERLLVAFGGSIWLQVLTFNRPLQPVKLTATCPIMGHTGEDDEL
jgi:hypothetical protein